MMMVCNIPNLNFVGFNLVIYFKRLKNCLLLHNGCSASRCGLRVTICPSRAAAISSGLVAMIGMSQLGDITTGISDPCR
jgi:hypothetical protein